MNIALILSTKFASSQWSLDGNDYEGLTWLDDSPKPSKKELESLWPDVQFEAEYEIVEKQRQTAYQQEADPIFFQAQRGKKTEKEWLAKIAEIDERYPYPVKEEQ